MLFDVRSMWNGVIDKNVTLDQIKEKYKDKGKEIYRRGWRYKHTSCFPFIIHPVENVKFVIKNKSTGLYCNWRTDEDEWGEYPVAFDQLLLEIVVDYDIEVKQI